jgi:hypothetical protein
VETENDALEPSPPGEENTGRLFRSLHAQGGASRNAIPALDLDEVVTLRSVSLRPTDARIDATAALPTPLPEPFVELFRDEPPPPAVTTKTETEAEDTPGRIYGADTDQGGFSAPIGVAIVVIATVLMGFADIIVTGAIGVITGIALVAVSAYVAMGIRLRDAFWAIVAPPIAIFLTVITAGQWSLGPGGSFFLRQGVLIPFTLGRNALWIIGAVVITVAIVLIRRRRNGRTASQS